MKKKFSIVIPILNEAQNIQILVAKIKKYLKKLKYEVIFVDDNSSDGSNKILNFLSKKNKKIKYVLRKNKNRDLSLSCFDGIKKSLNDIIIIMDGDAQHDPKYILKMLNEYEKNKKLNLVIAVRNFNKRILGMSLFRVFFSKLLIKFIVFFFGKRTLDPMSGFFLFEKKFFMKNHKKLYLKGYKLLADILYNSETKIVSKDIVIKFQKRKHGKSKMNFKILLILIGFLINNKLRKFNL